MLDFADILGADEGEYLLAVLWVGDLLEDLFDHVQEGLFRVEVLEFLLYFGHCLRHEAMYEHVGTPEP